MVKLAALPEYEIVKGLRGTIDFFCWKGLFLARSWPRYTGYNTLPGPARNQPAFGYIKQQHKSIDTATFDALTSMIQGTQRVYSDEQVTLYMGHDSALPSDLCIPFAYELTTFDNCAFA